MPFSTLPPDTPLFAFERAMPLTCPRCGTTSIEHRNYGQKVGAVIGSLTVALGSVSALRSVPHIVSTVQPSLLNTAVMAALSGALAGCNAGSALGEALDQTLFKNHRCLRCNHTFQSPKTYSGDQ